MRGADSDREFCVSGIVDRQRQACRRGTVLAGDDAEARSSCGDDDHDAGPHEPIDFDAERTLAAREPLGLEVVADTQVHAVHQQPSSVAVEALDVLQCGNDASDGPRLFSPSPSSTFRLRSLHSGAMPEISVSGGVTSVSAGSPL